MADDLQPEDSQRDAPPFRIATVGLSQNAIFHLEAAAIRDGLQPVVAARTDETNAADEPVPGCPTCSLDALVDRSDIDVVFVCGPVESRIDTAVRLLQSQQHIVVEPSADLPPELIERLIDESSAAARCCYPPTSAEFRRSSEARSLPHCTARGGGWPGRIVTCSCADACSSAACCSASSCAARPGEPP